MEIDGRRADVVWAANRTRGIVLNNEISAAPRGLLLRFSGRSEATRVRMDQVRRKWGWGAREFKVAVGIAKNQILIGGYRSDPDQLPEGDYEFRIYISDLKLDQNFIKARIENGLHAQLPLIATEDPRAVMLTTNDREHLDSKIRRLFENEQPKLDDMTPWNWLLSDAPRERRKACFAEPDG